MIDTYNFSKEEVKKSSWQDELPESDEMESEWNSAEGFLSLDCLEYSLCNILRLEDWDNS